MSRRRWWAALITGLVAVGLVAVVTGGRAGVTASGSDAESVAEPAVGFTGSPFALPFGWSLSASASHGLGALPAAADSVVSGALGAGDRAFWVRARRGGLVASNAADGLRSSFSSAGVAINTKGDSLSLRLASVTEGGRSVSLRLSEPTAHRNRVVSSGPGVSQWFLNGPLGLEQGFTLSRPSQAAAGSESVRLALATAGSLRPQLADGSGAVDLVNTSGATVLRYSGLTVTDRKGRPVPARLQVNGTRIVIAVAPVPASAYPLRVDPFVALSGDGTTAVVTAPDDGIYDPGVAFAPQGAVFMFAKSGSTWTQQGPKISVPSGYYDIGVYVAVSANGNTALVSGSDNNEFQYGSAPYPQPVSFVLSRSGSSWAISATLNQGRTDTAPCSEGDVALSADGTEALLADSCTNSYAGTVYIYTEQGGSWSQQTAINSPDGGAYFGATTALSGDGTVALITEGSLTSNSDSTLAFVKSGSAWTEKQEWSGVGANADYYGVQEAVSGDGNTVALADGSVWVRSSSTSAWTQQATGLLPTGLEIDDLALSSDGSTLVLSGVSSPTSNPTLTVWVSTRSGTTWPAPTQLLASSTTNLGPAVVNACGSEILAGWDGYGPDPSGDTNQATGEAFVFASDSGSGDGSCTAATGGGGGKSGGGGGAYGGAIFDAAKASATIKGAAFIGDSAAAGQAGAGGAGGAGSAAPTTGSFAETGGTGGGGGAGGTGGPGGGGVLDSLGSSSLAGSVLSGDSVAGGALAADCTDDAGGPGCGGTGGPGGDGQTVGQAGTPGAAGTAGTGTDPGATVKNGGMAKVTISTSKLRAGRVGQTYGTTLAAKGGVPFYKWTATGLPAGLQLDASSGEITGKPKRTGKYHLKVTVTDPDSAQRTTAKATLTLTVKRAKHKKSKKKSSGALPTVAATCNQSKLQPDIDHGGTLEFHGACTLQLTKTLTVPANDHVVIDGNGFKVAIEGIDSSSRLFAKDGAVPVFSVKGGLTIERLTVEHGEALGTDGTVGTAGADGTAGAAGTAGTAGSGGGIGAGAKDGDGGGLNIAAGGSATTVDITFLDDTAQGGVGGTGGSGGNGGNGGAPTGNGAPGAGGAGGTGGSGGSGGNGLGGAIYNAGNLTVLGGSFTNDDANGGNGAAGGPGGTAGSTGSS
jgi:hypothetical protein